jgi:hypothetical protein
VIIMTTMISLAYVQRNRIIYMLCCRMQGKHKRSVRCEYAVSKRRALGEKAGYLIAVASAIKLRCIATSSKVGNLGD